MHYGPRATDLARRISIKETGEIFGQDSGLWGAAPNQGLGPSVTE